MYTLQLCYKGFIRVIGDAKNRNRSKKDEMQSIIEETLEDISACPECGDLKGVGGDIDEKAT